VSRSTLLSDSRPRRQTVPKPAMLEVLSGMPMTRGAGPKAAGYALLWSKYFPDPAEWPCCRT